MTRISKPAMVADGPLPSASDNYLTHTRGIGSWLFTLDHKRIGVMFLVCVLAALALGAFFATLVRTELILPGPTIMHEEMYNRAFTLHGAIMIFLFILPGIPSAFGNFVLPIMLGAKDVAFPRLNLASFHLYAVGTVFFVCTLLLGGIDTGWTFYAPYSVTTQTAVATAVTGAFILGFSSIFTGINFIVTTHMMRAPGMTWFKLPLFVWGLYATAVKEVRA